MKFKAFLARANNGMSLRKFLGIRHAGNYGPGRSSQDNRRSLNPHAVRQTAPFDML
jgi:hypothetical protein